MNKMVWASVMMAGLALVANVKAGDLVIADFEGQDVGGWQIPDWALEKKDHVAKELSLAGDFASVGKKSLKISAAFPGTAWAAAVVEAQDYLDLKAYSKVAVDIYLPAEAPEGLAGNIVLTVGEGWTWTEQLKNIPLKPGQWTTVTVDVAPGSLDFKKTKVDEAFRTDIRKIDIRVISDKKAAYNGPVYIDNLRAM